MSTSIPEFDLSQLYSLKVGDMLEMPPLMQGIAPDEVVVGLVEKVSKKSVELVFSYFGVFLARRTITKNAKGEYSWA